MGSVRVTLTDEERKAIRDASVAYEVHEEDNVSVEEYQATNRALDRIGAKMTRAERSQHE